MDAIMRAAIGGQSRLVAFGIKLFQAIERSRMKEADRIIRDYLLSLDDKRLAELGYHRRELLRNGAVDRTKCGAWRF